MLIQRLLNLDQLLMLVFVLPANERQHIQPIGTVWQADPQHPAGVVMLTPMRTVGIVTFLTLARHEQWPLHRLHGLPDMPGLARRQQLPAVWTPLQLTFYNHSLCVRKTPPWTMTRPFTHSTSPAARVAPILSHSGVITRQSGGC